MIRKNPINCKIILEKRSGEDIHRDCMEHLIPGKEACPYCKDRGDLQIHGYYDRSLIEFIDGRPVKVSLCICRLICTHCKRITTHAVLPDPIIPYCRHSLFFILRVLTEHAYHLRSVEKICDVFEISLRTFYRWQKLFNQHRSEWQGLLSFMKKDLKASILELFRRSPYSVFAESFFKLTTFSLLQSHKNPADPQRKAVSPKSSPP